MDLPIYSERNAICNNALNWGATNGWCFELRHEAATPAVIYPSIVNGNKFHELATRTAMTTNVWYDLALTLDKSGEKDVFAVYIYDPDYGLRSQIVEVTKCADLSGSYLNVGHEDPRNKYATDNNAYKHFLGDMHRFIMWDRALTKDEVMEAFGCPPLLKLGTDNDSGGEFAAEGEGAEKYNAARPWHEFKGTLTAESPETAIALNVPDPHQGFAYLFHAKAAEAGTGAAVELAINGKSLGSRNLATGKDAYWFVPVKTMAAGENTITLTRKKRRRCDA